MVAAGFEPELTHYTTLMACARNDLQKCLQIYQEMQSRNIRPSGLTYMELVLAHVNANDGEGARRVLETSDFGEWVTRRKYIDLVERVRAMMS